MQNSKQDSAQNNKQVSNTNDLENFKNGILRAIRQEVIQNSKHDSVQNSKQVSNTNIK